MTKEKLSAEAIQEEFAQIERAYKDHYDWTAGPFQSDCANSNTQAAEFAKLLVQSFVLLHGARELLHKGRPS